MSVKDSIIEALKTEDVKVKLFNFIKKWLQHGRFPVNIANFLRTAFSL